MLTSNHLSILDGPLLFALIERENITALVTTKYQNNLVISWLVNTGGGIWLNREELDVEALREALSYMAQGGAIGIAPEGTRSQVGGLIEGKPGVAYLASKANVPVVPAAVWGAEVVVRQIFRLRRATVRVRLGKPFTLPPLDRRDRSAGLQRNTVEIMCQIAALLPEQYHGVYAGNPRVKELQAGL